MLTRTTADGNQCRGPMEIDAGDRGAGEVRGRELLMSVVSARGAGMFTGEGWMPRDRSAGILPRRCRRGVVGCTGEGLISR